MELNEGSGVLSIHLQGLIQKLESNSTELWNSSKHVCYELQNWRSILPGIFAVLEDAEGKQMTNHAVKMWLSDLRDMAYKMMDVLDQLEANARRQKLLPKTKAITSIARLMPTVFKSHHSEIKDITVRLKRIETLKNTLGLAIIVGKLTSKPTRRGIRFTSSLVDETIVYGRESAKDAILCQLLNVEGSNEGPSVIAILGMGGLGKTTLARLIYNDVSLYDLFKIRVWCSVSDQFDAIDITHRIIESITLERCDSMDLSRLQRKLRDLLHSKKFLLVLDDVWNENYYNWDALRKPFESGAPGSKIIITTRSQMVAKVMAASRVYHLELLSDDICLSLFARHALGCENFDAFPDLKGIGEALVKRCKGLPLVLKTLGGMLRGTMDRNTWMDILNNEIWENLEGGSGILRVLQLSYRNLPAPLKLCFACCALFPYDYEIDKDILISLWMVKGLLEGKEMERLGLSYINDFLSRSFLQLSSSSESRLVMHDLMRDLAQRIAGEKYCSIENRWLDGRSSIEKVIHLSFFRGRYDTYERFKILGEMKSLKTFLQLSSVTPFESHLSDRVLDEVLPKLRCLRMLSFSGYSIRRLPDSIGKLKLLLYFNLSGTEIQSLPDSVGSLVLLKMLLLCGCRKLTKLPATIANLSDLLYLDISETESLEVMPLGICNLKNLLMLPKFIVGKAGGLRLKDLNHLKDLRGKLHILDLHNVWNVQDASEAHLCMIEGLDELILEWTPNFHNS